MSLSFRYLIGSVEQPVIPGSPLWESPLPMDRHHFRNRENIKAHAAGMTHGDYFTAARRFLEEDGRLVLSMVLAREPLQNIIRIDICLMKHGEYYHPARIAVAGNAHRRFFVLNVAVSEAGCRIIDWEIDALERFGKIPGPSFVPRFYGRGSVSMGTGQKVQMFLGEWFEGYHEFHLSSRSSRELCMWEGDAPSPLSREAAYLIYHQAAKILTSYYNTATTEHISHWHHASGDFVVQCRGNQVNVRLITVRHYGPLLTIDDMTQDPVFPNEKALAALLLFLIGLSIRMRLDRREGTGVFAWAEEVAVVATWNGFLEGLSDNRTPAACLPDPVPRFQSHLATYSPADLRDLAETLAAALPVGSGEKAVIEKHLDSHVAALLDTIRRVGFP